MSAALSRRQRQWVERENLILETARSFIHEKGFLSLTMSELADAVEYSVGTLYRHFETKEDLLVALAVQSIERRARLFDRIKELDRITRDRIYGILVVRLLLAHSAPETFEIERLASSPSIWKRATVERYRSMVDMEQCCSSIVADIIAEAMAAGDLDSGRVGAGDIIFGLWSMSVGFHRLVQSFDDVQQVGLADAEVAVKKNYCMLLDSYGWEPLRDWRAGAVEQDIRQSLLPQAG
ncbi:MAG: TetR/AcrR family transcriptional regulator [Chloroflexi bacterium]|nr:TetR/AcrR family transcriptional regulator [Chloroflexota bacterium]